MKYLGFLSTMTKSEMLMYLYLITEKGEEGGEVDVSCNKFIDLGFSKSRFYEARSKLMEKKILTQKQGDIFLFVPIRF